MVESIRSKSNIDRIKDTIARLTYSQINMSTKIDNLILCLERLETIQPFPASSASTPYL